MVTEMTSSVPAYVLYVDHQGHPAPLVECFHATASRHLSSRVSRFPASVSTGVDSVYCPQCLSFYDGATGLQDIGGYCPKAICRSCPVCLSVASVHVEPIARESSGCRCIYKCGCCDWTSQSSRINTNDDDDDDGEGSGVFVDLPKQASRLEVMRAAEEMGNQLTEQSRLENQPIQDLHKYITQQVRRQQSDQRDTSVQQKASSRNKLPISWSVESLEKKIQENQHKIQPISSSIPGVSIRRISLLDEDFDTKQQEIGDPDDRIDKSLPLLAYQRQILQFGKPFSSLPLSIPFHFRHSIRCRAELANGRPGILLKPKLNPLEGDSSLPSGHGQWYRKDGSAIHIIPRVRIVQMRKVGSNHRACLVRVSNATLGMVRVRFAPSSYTGELDHWNESTDLGVDELPTYASVFRGLLVDTFHQTFVDAKLEPNRTIDNPTQSVELQSAEDSIIELGGQTRTTPQTVLNWDPAIPNQESYSSKMELVTQSASEAWFTLFVKEDDTMEGISYCAIPVAMEIDLGKGSWESPMIPKLHDDDTVTFQLVMIWSR